MDYLAEHYTIKARTAPLPDVEPEPPHDEPAAPAAPVLTLYDYQLAANARVAEVARELTLMGWAV
jgi:hypothetical protein